MPTPAEVLIATLQASKQWPPDSAWSQVQALAAFRDSDIDELRELHQSRWDRNREYIPDPLPALISRAYADLLVGKPPAIQAADEADQDNLDEITSQSDLVSESHVAAQISSSEGEVWWKVYTDRMVSDRPIIQFVSRREVVALWRGRTPIAIAFVTTMRDEGATVERLLEVHEPGRLINRLYRGTRETLGNAVALTSNPSLADLPDEWLHGLSVMLAGRIINKPALGYSNLGRSDYQGCEPMFLALNEAATIGVENARLTAKKRLFVDRKYLDQRGDLPAGSDVFLLDNKDFGDGDKSGVYAIEYSFDADQLIAYQRDLVDRVITRTGLVAQWVGASVDGSAESGTALRVRMVPATLAANGKSLHFQKGLRDALLACQLVDALPQQSGGFERPYSNAGEAPSVQFTDPIPPDAVEDSQRLATLSASELQSRRRSVEELHPDLTIEQVDEELALIEEDTQRVLGVVPDIGSSVP